MADLSEYRACEVRARRFVRSSMPRETRSQNASVRRFTTAHVAKSPSLVFPYFYHRRPLGFFEYSINVRKSYITSRECTRCEGSWACLACYRLLFSLLFRPTPSKRATQRNSRYAVPFLPAEPIPPSVQPDPSFPFSIFVYLNFNAKSLFFLSFLPRSFLSFPLSVSLANSRHEQTWRILGSISHPRCS